jgi:hypothetical protein
MSDDIQWVEADGYPLAGTYAGPQAVLEGVFMRRGEIGDEFAVVPEQFVADGDIVVALGNVTWDTRTCHQSTSAVERSTRWRLCFALSAFADQFRDVLPYGR